MQNKCSKIMLVFLLMMIFSPVFSAKANPSQILLDLEQHQKPFTNANQEESAIIVLDKPLTKNEIKKMLQPYKNLKLKYIYSEVFHGFSLRGPKFEIQKLTSLGQVQDVHQSFTYQLDALPYQTNDKPSPNYSPLSDSVDFIGTNAIRYLTDENGNRLTGKGIKVGIIDTGVDYTHPDLRHAYVKGYDFIDDDADPMETRDLGALNTLHGTHVAGVIVAKGHMTGIAPDAKLYAYRALGPGGTGTTEDIIAAIDQAIKDKVDVLNLSIGISINGPDLPVSLALDTAVQKGIIAVTSNGNSGPDLWTVGSPGTSHRAISVGASTPHLEIPYLQVKEQIYRITPLVGSSNWKKNRSYTLVDGKLGHKEDLENLNIKGNIVLMKRGEIEFYEKVKNALEFGAAGVIIFNNVEGEFMGSLPKDVPIPAASISMEDGERIIKQFTDKSIQTKIIFKKEADTLAPFSSRGPVTYTWNIKPDLVAPGVAITSTVPGGYLPLQGTSMAAPHVAGASAILKQAHPDWTPEQIKAALMNTSIPLQTDNNQPYETFEQGAGRIQLTNALSTNTLIKPGALLFGETNGEQFQEKKRVLVVENVSDQPIRYSFTTPKRSEEINWELPHTFYLLPGEKKRIEISIEVKNNHQENQIYNGYLELQANDQKIFLPYLYVVEEPDYPRIMAFTFGENEDQENYQYELYLPGGADECGIAIYDPDTYHFLGYLEYKESVRRGWIKNDIENHLPIPDGVYLAVAFAKKGERFDYLEQIIELKKH